jgi:hypothetical protein
MGATPTLHQRNKLKPHELIDIDIDPPWPIRDFVRFWRAFIVASSQCWRRVSKNEKDKRSA